MPKVTSVERQKKNTRRFNIFLDGEFAFGADEDLVVNFRLIPGKIIDPQELEKILFESQVGKLMEKMYGLFAIRGRSEKEVRDRLRSKNFELKLKAKEEISNLVIKSLIEKLKQKGLINDLEFAKAWVDSRRKSKHKSILVIKSELFQKGIDREIVEEVFSRGATVSEEELATQALEKKLKSWQRLSEMEFKKKAYEFLARRGFDYSTISVVVANYIKKR